MYLVAHECLMPDLQNKLKEKDGAGMRKKQLHFVQINDRSNYLFTLIYRLSLYLEGTLKQVYSEVCLWLCVMEETRTVSSA